MNVIETRNLSAYYMLDIYGRKVVVKAVDNISISFNQNEIYGIAGESGCGKSTLLKVLFDLVEPPLRIVNGEVLYIEDNKSVSIYKTPLNNRRKYKWRFISYVPQGSMNVLNPVRKISQTFEDFLKPNINNSDPTELKERIVKHILELGLRKEVLDAYPHQLSGGMRQRVTIALATILTPRVIIADEPTTALDVVTQRGVIQILKDIQSRFNNTIILVTHDMGVHANVADRIGIMYAGKFVEEAKTAEIFENPLHPYTKFLIDSLPQFGDGRKRESAPGSPPSLSSLPEGCAFHPRCPYAMAKCKASAPQFIEVDKGHKVACWLYSGVDL
ncbi:MAG: ABC transporter ATP-binding protein [Fervidobacterium pennivorans]|uniref:ABC transporter ATP-binding protein n=2 Tax=Fervidobacterium TaxID=2422 RepID=A0A7C4W5R4_FERPE|nr:ABC transporter ATP-binding protein [Fervidobacterium changbaicum]MDM7320554.1 ABC transporter ATP-binding protein [Fervidobacterium sp.]QAV34231.1 ABC transporter ATP-binding protein [Fervidobacterium changbaicum]SDH67927.1 peptide/nickel transport system ATP-binding protein [Fervidobacterium changbaicum]